MGTLAAVLVSLAAIPAVGQAVQNVELHGYMLNRFYANPSSSARFVSERLSLSAVAQLGSDGTAYVELYFHPWLPSVLAAEQYRTYLESAYVDLPLWNGRIRFGKGRQLNFGMTPSYPNRKTSQYGIIAETFTQDRIVGAQWSYKGQGFDGGFTVMTDQNIGERGIGDFAGNTGATDVVRHLVDKDDPANNTGELAVTTRWGITRPNFQIHLSGAIGELNKTDANKIASAYGLASTTNTDHDKWGLDVMWSRGPWVAQAEYYDGSFSFLDIKGWNVLVGYQPKDKMRAYVRWAELDNDQPTLANERTWDTQQLMIGIVQPIREGVWLEFQYEKNMEDPPAGVSEKDNDLLFVEFFTGF